MEKFEPTPVDYKKAEEMKEMIEPELKNLDEMRERMLSSLEKMGKKGFLNKELFLLVDEKSGLNHSLTSMHGEIDGHEILAILQIDLKTDTITRKSLTVDTEDRTELFSEFYETYSEIAYDINIEADEREKLRNRKSQEEQLQLRKEEIEEARNILF